MGDNVERLVSDWRLVGKKGFCHASAPRSSEFSFYYLKVTVTPSTVGGSTGNWGSLPLTNILPPLFISLFSVDDKSRFRSLIV
jgi:hypothetical protein